MNFQKIILAGRISTGPEILKSKGNELDNIKFEVAVNYFTKTEVIFPVVLTGLFAEISKNQIIKGRLVIVEGKVEVDQSGKFSVSADWVEFDSSSKEKSKKSKLLF